MIKALIFDMDGTLIDSELLKAEAWKLTLEEYAIKEGDEFYRSNIGNTGIAIAKKAVEQNNLSVDPEAISNRRKELYEELLKKGSAPIQSTTEFLRSMLKEKVKLGLASSESRAIIDEQLKLAGIYGLFDVISSGKDEVQNNKPSPDIYLLTAKKLDIDPSRCLVIEDSSPGIEAAKKAGMFCIGYKSLHSGKQDMSKADFVVNDLSLPNLSEIFKHLLSTFKIMTDKVKTIDSIEIIVKGLKADNKKIVTTNGSFDILHAAHVNLLEKAKQEGDILIVLLNSDQSIKRSKGERRPIVAEPERTKMLAALRCVDYIVVFDDDKPLDYLSRIKSDVHVKGGSVVLEKMKEEIDFVAQWNGDFKHFPLEKGFSTTNIIEIILDRHKN